MHCPRKYLMASVQLEAALDECGEKTNYSVSHISHKVYPLL